MSNEAGETDFGVEISKGVAAKVVMAVLGFAGTIVFARVLGASSFGGFYLLLALVKIADRPMGGVSDAVKKRFSERASPKRELLGVLSLCYALMMGLAVVGAMTFQNVIASYTGISAAPVLFVVLFGSITAFYSVNQLLAARGWVGLQMWVDTFRSLLTLGLQLAFVLLGYGVAGMAYGLAAASVLCVPVSWYYLRVRPAVPVTDTVRSVWQYARNSIPSYFVGKAYERFDVLLLGFLLTPAAVGFYEVAYKLTIPATFITKVAGSALMPRISNLASKGKSVAMDVTNTVAFVSLLAIPVFFGAVAVPTKLVVTAYGAEYRPAATLLIGLAAYRVFRSQSTTFLSTVDGLDRPDVNLRISVVTLVFNVVTGYLLVLQFGAIGAVIATVAAEFLRYVSAARFVKQTLPEVELFPRLFFHQLIGGAVMFLFVVAARRYVTVDSWLTLLLVVAPAVVVYFGSLLAINAQFKRTSRQILQSLLKSV